MATGKFVAGLVVAILVCCAVSAMVCPCARADTGWSKTYGGANADRAYSLVQASDGGYAIVGDTISFGAGNYDVFLVKTDASGNQLWQKTYGGPNVDDGYSLIQTSDGGYAITGDTGGYAVSSGTDVVLIKTDASGNQVWQKTYGGTEGWSLVQTTDGGYAIAGGSGGDVFLVKTDADGNDVWQKTYGGANDDEGRSLVQTSDGGYAIAGYTGPSYKENDVLLVKTDANGNEVWQKTYGGVYSDAGWSLVQTGDGGYAIAGSTYSFGAGLFDVFLVKTDASGTLLWQKTYGGAEYDVGWSLVQTGDGGYAIAGYTWSFGAGNQDAFLVKTDASGTLTWQRTYGGAGLDEAFSIVQTADGGYAMAGDTSSFGAGSTDLWLIKTDELGVVLEGLTIGAVVTVSSIAVIVSTRYFRKRPEIKNYSPVKP